MSSLKTRKSANFHKVFNNLISNISKSAKIIYTKGLRSFYHSIEKLLASYVKH